MNEQFATVGAVELCYETFGNPEDPAMLLVMGLGTPMLAWHEDFCAELVSRGFFVTRFDNRDCGRSTWFEQVPPPKVGEIIRRRPRHVAYTLDDMAADAAGLLDHLGIDRAHVVGASMGGMIAQTLAVAHPERVHSLTSIMSNTGSRVTGQPRPRAMPLLLRRPPHGKDEYVQSLTRALSARRTSQATGPDAEMLELSFDRGVTAGDGRQMAAILASEPRGVAGASAPTLVIHGTADHLVSPSVAVPPRALGESG